MQQAGQGQVHEHHIKGPLHNTLLLQALRMLQVQRLATARWRVGALPPGRVGAPICPFGPVATCAQDFLLVSTIHCACEEATVQGPAHLPDRKTGPAVLARLLQRPEHALTVCGITPGSLYTLFWPCEAPDFTGLPWRLCPECLWHPCKRGLTRNNSAGLRHCLEGLPLCCHCGPIPQGTGLLPG